LASNWGTFSDRAEWLAVAEKSILLDDSAQVPVDTCPYGRPTTCNGIECQFYQISVWHLPTLSRTALAECLPAHGVEVLAVGGQPPVVVATCLNWPQRDIRVWDIHTGTLRNTFALPTERVAKR